MERMSPRSLSLRLDEDPITIGVLEESDGNRMTIALVTIISPHPT